MIFTSPKAINGFALRKKDELQVSRSPQKYAPPKKKPIIWLHPAGLNEIVAKVALYCPERWLALAGMKEMYNYSQWARFSP